MISISRFSGRFFGKQLTSISFIKGVTVPPSNLTPIADSSFKKITGTLTLLKKPFLLNISENLLSSIHHKVMLSTPVSKDSSIILFNPDERAYSYPGRVRKSAMTVFLMYSSLIIL